VALLKRTQLTKAKKQKAKGYVCIMVPGDNQLLKCPELTVGFMENKCLEDSTSSEYERDSPSSMRGVPFLVMR
jgi:hypothetical protein